MNYNRFYEIGGPKRKKLILTLIKEGKLSAKRILPKIDYNSNSFLSNEIKTINKNFQNEMELSHNLIEHSRAWGYFINPKFILTMRT